MVRKSLLIAAWILAPVAGVGLWLAGDAHGRASAERIGQEALHPAPPSRGAAPLAQVPQTPVPVVPVTERLRKEIPHYADLTDLERIDNIRDWVYSNSDIAADQTLLLSHDILVKQSVDRNIADMDENKGGYWCWGIANILMQVYKAAGYEAWQVDYGDLKSLTHSVTVVKVNGVLYPEDAYFNFHYSDASGRPMPYFEVLKRLAQGQVVPITSGSNRLRDVISDKTLDAPDLKDNWALQQLLPESQLKVRGKYFIYKSHTSLEQFVLACEQQNFLVPDAYRFLAQRHLPPNIEFLILFPFATVDEKGWVDNPKLSELLRQAQEFTPVIDPKKPA